MNKVILIGRLARNAEQVSTNVTRFSLAVDVFKKDGNGSAIFVSCVAFNKTAEILLKYGTKGKQIAVCGRLDVSEYKGKDEVMRRSTEVIAETIDLLGSSGPDAKPSTKTPLEDLPSADDDTDVPF